MSQLTPLISDLALILICAGIMTLIFKKLKQPLVLGYIVAGFICTPHFKFTPSVVDSASIHIWSEIGVIFLLFALGLEFSFKKLMKVGGSAVISACTIIFCMILVGVFVGWTFGWNRMDCIYLGGMLAMSSTTIIYKAFDDMGLRQQRFAGLVLSILILEDILAIVLMVMLSTMAVSQNFEGGEMVYSILKLLFFLILWFVVGIYGIPLFLKRVRKLMSDETLLIVSLALCFGMVYLAALVGFSPAFGAFIMGSILSETIESEHIGKLVSPVKDLFGAIFFVSVGMMVDPAMIVEYKYQILVIVLAVLLGQTIFGTTGVLLSGQPLKTAMQCGFSLTQIGEFAFIIASLGVSLKVTSHFLYPIVVAVSVITTFLTPYMIRLAVPAYNVIDKYMPSRWRRLLDRYSSGASVANHSNNWKKLVIAIIRIVLIYAVLSIAVTALFLHFIVPLATDMLGDLWGRILGAVLTITAIAPFLRAMIMKKNRSEEFKSLWSDSRFNHAPLISIILLRIVIAIGFIVFIIENLFRASAALMVGIAIIVVCAMILSRFLKKQSIVLERTFVRNLHYKEIQQEYLGEKQPKYAGRLLDRDLHLSDFLIPAESAWAGKTLRELDLGKKYDVHVASIIRGKHRLNIPDGNTCIFPNDLIQVIGTDEQLSLFASVAEKAIHTYDDEDFGKHEMKLKQFVVAKDSPFVGHSIIECGIRNKYHCLVVGIESAGEDVLRTPQVHMPLKEDDVVWVVGEEDDLNQLFAYCC
ncbi:cation:proton antiporter [Phocaeicola coprocola]|uniref:cation:proton antiporter n=1 Tax=Phocaeicola coprocola TaxID=310298 RepID=UPI001C37E7BB|nr:cation:proton antiporter [Phocaeicola coprocola]MBV3866710.1 cation:proton antiporter [Phocaeicola coprocola]MBV4007926.1 cation:proton antiporter [Phocaeicola coprocola]MBV4032387.1 cation:proton antiporter [Phocaeicola coprocola]MBV4038940.1 cation:proton antiporter [Phocaeicola coprocola]MBV4060575.1 cation:proton antiporter [Phocaeicola coprocola]